MRDYHKLPILICFLVLASCKKLVEIPEPVNTITTTETFSTPAGATSALISVYFDLAKGYNSSFDYANGRTSTYAGLSADELKYFQSDDVVSQFQNNTLVSTNSDLSSFFWNPAYYDIYSANSIIEGVSASSLSTALKTQLTGEAKFLRAFSYFYLVNLFGDVPIVTTTSWQQTSLIPRSATTMVYDQIVKDLKDAQSLLPDDYSASSGERFRANKSAATALLARVYLYLRQWSAAEQQSTLLIGNTSYSLETDLNRVFLKNSNEAILQWQVSVEYSPYATKEGNQLIPFSTTTKPKYILTDELLAAFESTDKRFSAWVDTTNYQGTLYYYPYKYKIRQGTPGGGADEYYMVLRLAEQYLIRAEARAQQNNLAGAISDLNVIRERAGLIDVPSSLDQTGVMNALEQERRIELFAEWGNRWFDLKRTGRADAILQPQKGSNWQSSDQLYPIPQAEIKLDPSLTQNPGY